MDKLVCSKNTCVGCMACVAACPKNAITIKDSTMDLNAVINPELCIECNLCKKVCQQNNPMEKKKAILWKQGWTKESKDRKKASSGGFAAAISKKFVEDGGLVCSCTFLDGKFGFEFATSVDQLGKFIGSKYVKSNPSLIYKEIKEKLKDGQKVLFIGLPCQVAGLKKYVNEPLQKDLYTIDLICHGTPSVKLLEDFLLQYNKKLSAVKQITFRKKGYFTISVDGEPFTYHGVRDRYTTAFLKGLCYTENCYSCTYATPDRISDLTIGDSWGSELEEKERLKGVSLAICQTEKGKELLENDNLYLTDVDMKKAIVANHQLNHPSLKLKEREIFFATYNSGKSFNKAVKKAFPKFCLKQDVKAFLIKAHLYK